MSSKQNIIYIYFKGKHLITSKSQYQYNHGQFLYFADLNLPQAFEVHFSNKDKGDSKTQIGSNKLVEIPDEYFWNGALMIYAWIYLHSETTDGETVYEVRIPLIKRAKPTDEEPLPQQQGTIDRAIAELNNAIEVTNENANKTEADKTIVANIKEDVINLKEDIDDTATVVGQKAQEAIDASERAEASAQNAAQYESNALNYSQQAEQSAQQALESKNIASQKTEVATNASSEALGYRDEALEAKNQAVQAKQNIVDYRDETKGYRDETLTIKNDVQTLKSQIDETAETVNTDAQSAEQSANSASQSASQAQEIADTLDNYLYATLSTDVNILALNGKKKTTKAESISVDVAAYKGDERLYITNITGVPIIYRNYITSMAIDYSMYKNNTYGFFRFAWNIENNWEIISDTTTSTITITAKDSEENVYTFEKPWTFLIVKDGDVGEDGFSVISLTNSFLIPTDENGIISDVTLLRADFRAYKGGTLINSKVLSAPAITLRAPNNPSVIRNKPWAKTSVASTTTYTSVTLEKGYKIASGEHGTYSFTINADGKDVALSIPWIIVKKGDTGNGISSAVLNSDYTLTLTFTDGTIYTTPSIRGAKGDKGDKGDTGATGAQGIQGAKGDTGADGYSPTVTITPITGGHRITITDADGEHSADVMDGDDYTLTAQDKQDIAELVDVPVDDVQINGSSIVSNGVANVPVASRTTMGVAKFDTANGIDVVDNAWRIVSALSTQIKGGIEKFRPITPNRQHESTFYGLAKSAGDTTQSQSSNAVGTYTDEAKTAIKQMLDVHDTIDSFVENVTGTDVTITGQPSYRYNCGEVYSLTVTPPSSGTIDFRFTSGSTPTVLTLPSTVKMPEWWVEVEANTIYEMCITDGIYCGVMSWAMT